MENNFNNQKSSENNAGILIAKIIEKINKNLEDRRENGEFDLGENKQNQIKDDFLIHLSDEDRMKLVEFFGYMPESNQITGDFLAHLSAEDRMRLIAILDSNSFEIKKITKR